jgi:hypothetical protein
MFFAYTNTAGRRRCRDGTRDQGYLLVGERLSSAHALSKPLARILHVTDVTAIAEGHCSISADSGYPARPVALGGPSSPPGGGGGEGGELGPRPPTAWSEQIPVRAKLTTSGRIAAREGWIPQRHASLPISRGASGFWNHSPPVIIPCLNVGRAKVTGGYLGSTLATSPSAFSLSTRHVFWSFCGCPTRYIRNPRGPIALSSAKLDKPNWHPFRKYDFDKFTTR